MIFSISTSLHTSDQDNEFIIREVLFALSKSFNPLYLDKTGNYYTIIYSSPEISFPHFILQFMLSALSYNPGFVILLTGCISIACIPADAITLSSLLETYQKEKLADEKSTSVLSKRIDNINLLINEYKNKIRQSSCENKLSLELQDLLQILSAMLIQDTYIRWINLNSISQAEKKDSTAYQCHLRELFFGRASLKITEQLFEVTNKDSKITPHVEEHDRVYVIFHFNKNFLNKLFLDHQWILSFFRKMIEDSLQTVVFDAFYMPPISVKEDKEELQIEVEMRFAILPSVRAEFHDSIIDLMLVNGIDPFILHVSIKHHSFPFLLQFPKAIDNATSNAVTQAARRLSVFESVQASIVDAPMHDVQLPDTQSLLRR